MSFIFVGVCIDASLALMSH